MAHEKSKSEAREACRAESREKCEVQVDRVLFKE